MAVDLKPSTYIASWSEDETNVTFPIASVPLLTAEEADGTTGDIRKVTFALVEQLYSVYVGIAAADRPTKMTIAKASSVNTETGVVTNSYTFRFFTEIVDQEVVAEA